MWYLCKFMCKTKWNNCSGKHIVFTNAAWNDWPYVRVNHADACFQAASKRLLVLIELALHSCTFIPYGLFTKKGNNETKRKETSPIFALNFRAVLPFKFFLHLLFASLSLLTHKCKSELFWFIISSYVYIKYIFVSSLGVHSINFSSFFSSTSCSASDDPMNCSSYIHPHSFSIRNWSPLWNHHHK